jgi:hypothetical protein
MAAQPVLPLTATACCIPAVLPALVEPAALLWLLLLLVLLLHVFFKCLEV